MTRRPEGQRRESSEDQHTVIQVQMAAGRGPFSTFKPAEESEARIEKAEINPRLERIARAWEKAVESQRYLYCSAYSGFAKAVRGIHITEREMDNVIAFLSQFQYIEKFPMMAGFFLSALVNTGRDNEYTIRTRLLSVRLDKLGYGNKKNIIVDGDVGDDCGYTYVGSSFLVKGDAGNYFGAGATGGLLSVEGSAVGLVGFRLNGATIIIHGNAGINLGAHMWKGTIRVGGTIESIGDQKIKNKGEIYQGEKRVWPKGWDG